jgi:hypothetical protein
MTSRRVFLQSTILIAVLFGSSTANAQSAKQDSIWQPMKALVGTWKGNGGGELGSGKYERSYRFIFNRKFIEVRNKSTYPPTANNPAGEVHEDLGYISYDKSRKTFVLRQFHAEGFVNQYKLDTMSADRKRFVFVSEAIENIAPGWRATETYELRGDDTFQEMFQLAPPNKPFEPYSTVVLERNK